MGNLLVFPFLFWWVVPRLTAIQVDGLISHGASSDVLGFLLYHSTNVLKIHFIRSGKLLPEKKRQLRFHFHWLVGLSVKAGQVKFRGLMCRAAKLIRSWCSTG